ncbi:MAG: ribonuclease P protein component [Lactovum sp.]
MKKSFRVKKVSDFEALFRNKNSFANRAFIVYQRENNLTHFRLGLSVGKKIGNAVTRNRLKRQIRSLVKSHSSHLQAVDFVVIARKGIEEYNYVSLEKNLIHLLTKSNIIKK